MSGYIHRFSACLLIAFSSLIFTLAVQAEPVKPSLVVIYKDQAGQLQTRVDEQGNTVLDIDAIAASAANNVSDGISSAGHSLVAKAPASFSQLNAGYTLSGDWHSSPVVKKKRSTAEYMSRLLIPFGAAAAAFGGISNDDLDLKGTDFQTNFGHYMVLATVGNLAQEVDEVMVDLLQEHNLGGIISPEWAAKGAVAVLMLGIGQLDSVGDKHHLSTGKAIRFFAQSRTINSASLFLGEASGQVLDRITDLSPEKRKLVTSAIGGTSTGILYFLLTEMFGGRGASPDLHSKISNATVLGFGRATTPFVEDFVGQWTNNKVYKSMGSQALLASVSLPIAGGLYALLYNQNAHNTTHAWYLSKLVAGSFTKLGGAAAANILGNNTINALAGSDNSWASPALKAVSYLSVSLMANAMFKNFGVTRNNPILQEALYKFRDGVYVAALAGGTTAIIEDLIHRIEPDEQPNASLSLTLTRTAGSLDSPGQKSADLAPSHTEL